MAVTFSALLVQIQFHLRSVQKQIARVRRGLCVRSVPVSYTHLDVYKRQGEWFAQQVIEDQGGMDYQDIMALRNVMDGVGWVDTSKVGVTGGSYGGFMTNWIVGHTDKFAAAVTQRSISNSVSYTHLDVYKRQVWDSISTRRHWL